jgi:hypothetical protein
MGEETCDETVEYAEGVDADSVKYAKHMSNDVIYTDHYPRLGYFCSRLEQIQT